MRPKIKLLAHNVELRGQERAKSNQIKKQLLISQEKVHIIIKFKPPTFVLPPPKDIVPPKNNHSTSSLSNLGFPYFLPKNNLFSLSKTTPTCLEKGNSFTLPSSSYFFSLPIVTVVSVDNATTGDVVVNAVRATYLQAETLIEAVNTHHVVTGDHHAATEEDLTVSIAARIVVGAVGRHSLETATRSLKLVDTDSCSSFVFDVKC